MPEDKPPEKPDWLKPEEFDEVEHLPETPLEQMRQEHVTNLRTPAFNREVTLADVLLELRKHHVEMVLEDVLVELKAIRTAIESVIQPAVVGNLATSTAHVRIDGHVITW